MQRDIASYAGYDTRGDPLYVGTCCQDQVDELATHVYWWWHADRRPDSDTPLWRYMDFAKFVAVLEGGGLYFARADLLGDKFEGASGIDARRGEWDAHYLASFRKAIQTAPRGSAPIPSDDEIEKHATRLLSDFHKISESELRSTYVSCWHANTVESEALWRLYCPPPTPSVAIRTDLCALSLSWGDDSRIEFGKVNYIDFRRKFAGPYDHIYTKRQSLSHEAEVRAVMRCHDLTTEPGILVKFDLVQLAKAVVVSPFAPPWFENVLKATIRSFGIALQNVKSELLAEPFF